MVFYADVYFLINFTVDTLAIFFAVSVCKISTSVRRILFLAAIGAALALVNVIYGKGFAQEILLSLFYFFLIAVFAAKRISVYRRIKLAFIFVILEFLLGGLVEFAYGFLDRYFYTRSSDMKSVAEPNRRLILLALTVLLSIALLKLLMLFFSHSESARVVTVEISLLGRTKLFDALVDTGNFLTDVSSKKPVILLKANAARSLNRAFPLDSSALANPDCGFLSRISLIPTSSLGGRKIIVGVRPDKIRIISKRNGSAEHVIDAVVAADNEGGTYDGYEALMPAAAIDDVL